MSEEIFEVGDTAWLNIGGEPEDGAGCFECKVTAVHTPNQIDVEITDEREVDLADLQAKIIKGLKIDGKYSKSLAKAVDAGARTVSGLDPAQVGELKMALRDLEWASKPNGYDDMVLLKNLNDAELNQNLRTRFHKDLSYCYCGNTCVCLNIFYSCGRGKPSIQAPFIEDYPHAGGEATGERLDPFSKEMGLLYMGKDKSISKDEGGNEPHVYGVAEDGYQHMFADHAGGKKNNQAIIITGESGAGKTYITGKLLEYLDQVNNVRNVELKKPPTSITDQIKKTMPIMDNFGNACMPRNDDSSRFGKLYKIYYEDVGKTVTGAKVEPYLLEKSRVSSQLSWERNFHIFYRMVECFSQDPEKKEKFHILEHCGLYKYLNRFLIAQDKDGNLLPEPNWNPANKGTPIAIQNDTGEVCQFTICDRYNFDNAPHEFKAKDGKENYKDAGSDAKEFKEFQESMASFFEPQLMDQIYSITSAVLLLGNIEFESDENKVFAAPILNLEVIDQIAELLKIPVGRRPDGVDPGKKEVGGSLQEALTITVLSNGTVKGIGKLLSQGATDAFAQALYNDLFVQIIESFSKNLLGGADPDKNKFLGLLDIFGFEFIQESQLSIRDEKKKWNVSSDYNGINQFFINLCNEKLQNHFVASVFDLEINAFKDQGLTTITADSFGFERNDATLEALMGTGGGKTGSVINLMNDKSIKGKAFPSGLNEAKVEAKMNEDNADFRKELDKAFGGKNPEIKCYSIMTPANQGKPSGYTSEDKGFYHGDAFGVRHYAASVIYKVDQWWEANKATLPKMAHEVMTTSTWGDYLKDVVDTITPANGTVDNIMKRFLVTRDPDAGGAATIGGQFVDQLAKLVDKTLNEKNATCQFVRCIKPNKDKKSRATAVGGADKAWQSSMVLNQLQYTGMLDTLMIRKKGFPARPDHATFWKNFTLLEPSIPNTDVKGLYDAIKASEVGQGRPELFDPQTHYYFGAYNKPSAPIGESRVLMKDATYRYLESQVEVKRKDYVTVLRSMVQSAHLCAKFDVDKTAAKVIFPAAVKLAEQDKKASSLEIPQMAAEQASMKEFMQANIIVEMKEKEERERMSGEEKWLNDYMMVSALARYTVQKEENLKTATDAIVRCQEHYAKLDALLATAEFGLDPQSLDFTPEALADISKATPEPEDLADISKPKFVNIKSSKARPPRRPGATKTRFKFAPKKQMNQN